MDAASTDIAGSMMRLLKSSSDKVISTEVNVVSTPFWVVTFRVTWFSVVSCVERAAPVRTVYWFGSRMRSAEPIFAPSLAKLSS